MLRKLSKTLIQNVQLPVKGRLVIRDTIVQGFNCTITPKGSKSFYLYRRVDRKPKRIFIGRFGVITVEQARSEAARLSTEIELGKTPETKKQRQKTFGDAWEWYLEHHAKIHNKSWKHAKNKYEKHLQCLEKVLLSDLKRDRFVELRNKVAEDAGKVQANAVISLAKTIIRNAVENGWTDRNPATGIKPFQRNRRKRIVTPEEMPKFFEAVEALPARAQHFIFLCLYTGARKSNVYAMKWADIDQERKIWTIPASESKNKRELEIPLTDAAIELLNERVKMTADSRYVFPARIGSGHVGDMKHYWDDVKEKSGIADITIHDLRRTLASWQASAGSNSLIIGKSLGHEDSKSTDIYTHPDSDLIRQSMNNALNAIKKTVESEKNKNNQK